MTNAREQSQHGHAFRPGPFHQRRAYWLDGAMLHWRIGSSEGHVALTDIASMRLNLAEGTNSAARCVLVEKTGRVHKLNDLYWPRWTKGVRRYWGRLQRRDATFRGLTFTLARRLKKANPEVIVQTGPGRGEWLASCIMAVLAVAIVIVGLVLMVVHGRFEPAAAAFMALAAIYLPILWPVIRSGGPKPLDLETLHNANPPPD
ncbi:hypothetical protein [Paracoccus sp. SSJ]|uniref:hypothetical protein n=1 Tax=Paracoccus sp. SSJ TaxID=3050636 RepID=UPI00254FA831|nr:hypothetical protein [Paracoccus sp. SSJ]MDK8874207.1 hypothetical protein [Paracoccus sp. SSJ]